MMQSQLERVLLRVRPLVAIVTEASYYSANLIRKCGGDFNFVIWQLAEGLSMLNC